MVNQSIFPLRPPFVEMVVCVNCGEEVPTRDAVAVCTPNGQWDGMAHRSCPEEGVEDVPVKGNLL